MATNFTNEFELHEFDLPGADEWLLDIPICIRANKFAIWVFNQLVNQSHKITKIHEILAFFIRIIRTNS